MAQAMFNYQNEMQEQNFMDGTMEMQNLLNSMKMNQFTESNPDQDFFQDDNDTKKTTQKIEKNRNLIVIEKLSKKFFNQHCL